MWQLWEMIMRRKSGRRCLSTKIRRLAKKVGLQKPLSCTRQEAADWCCKSAPVYHQIKLEAANLRQSWLKGRQEDLSATHKERQLAEKMLAKEHARQESHHFKCLRAQSPKWRSTTQPWITQLQ